MADYIYPIVQQMLKMPDLSNNPPASRESGLVNMYNEWRSESFTLHFHPLNKYNIISPSFSKRLAQVVYFAASGKLTTYQVSTFALSNAGYRFQLIEAKYPDMKWSVTLAGVRSVYDLYSQKISSYFNENGVRNGVELGGIDYDKLNCLWSILVTSLYNDNLENLLDNFEIEDS